MKGRALPIGALFLGACSSSAAPSAAPAPEATSTSEPNAPSPAAPVAPPAPFAAGETWTTLFDGTLGPEWRMSTITNQPGRDDPGHFAVEGGVLVAYPGTDLGLFWNTTPMPPNFLLELEWRLAAADDNSGVFLRFPHLDSKGYDNTAWVAVNFGFEVQINEPGSPDGAPEHTTGAIYAEKGQSFTRVVAKPPGSWNAYVIRVENQSYTVTLNGTVVSRFDNTVGGRGLPSTPQAPSYVGLQTHTGHVAFRNVRMRSLP